MTSLIRLFGFPYEQSAGRSFREMRWSYTSCLDQVLLQSTKSRWSQVSWWQHWSFGLKPSVFRGMENAPCLFTFQKRWEPGGLRNPQTPAQLSGMDPGPHKGVGPGGFRQQYWGCLCCDIATQYHWNHLQPSQLLEKSWWHEEWEWASWQRLSSWRRCCWYVERAL